MQTLNFSSSKVGSLFKASALALAVSLTLSACSKSSNDSSVVMTKDADKDGIVDDKDNCPNIANKDQKDTDKDGQGDVCDVDKDGDGINDDQDAFPLDKNETLDTDGDGTGNNADTDDDDDGVDDINDAFPLNKNETLDTDGDGTGNNADADDDDDGVDDDQDAFPLDKNETLDTDGDGTGNNADDDDDDDGVNDADDAFPLDKNETLDTDGDGTGNNADDDDDDDGVSDADEIEAGTDPLDKDDKPSPVQLPTSLVTFDFDNGVLTPTDGSKKDDIQFLSSSTATAVENRNGEADKAIMIDEGDDIIRVNNFLFDTTTATPNPSFTYSTWIKLKNKDTYHGLLSFDGRDMYLRINNDAHCSCLELKGNGFISTYNNDRTPLAKDTWTNIAMTYDSGTLKFYQDGSLIGESSGNSLKTTFEELGIGGYSTGTESLQGDMDDVHFYDEALSAEQIKALYDLQNTTSP